MSAESELLRAVQEKLAEKDEIIFELQRQITSLMEGGANGAAAAHGDEDELIREQMLQIVELSERVEQLEASLAEKEEVIREQMSQLLELSEDS